MTLLGLPNSPPTYILTCIMYINELHLPKKRKGLAKSPTAQEVFRPISGLISCTKMYMHAIHVTLLHPSHNTIHCMLVCLYVYRWSGDTDLQCSECHLSWRRGYIDMHCDRRTFAGVEQCSIQESNSVYWEWSYRTKDKSWDLHCHSHSYSTTGKPDIHSEGNCHPRSRDERNSCHM